MITKAQALKIILDSEMSAADKKLLCEFIQGDENPKHVQEVIDYFNQVTGKKVRGTDKIRSMVSARLKQYGMDEVKRVIKMKCDEWCGHEFMNKYVALDIFMNATKFERYSNEMPAGKYPAEWSAEYERKLTPQQMQEWWAELRAAGKKAVKNKVGMIVKWI